MAVSSHLVPVEALKNLGVSTTDADNETIKGNIIKIIEQEAEEDLPDARKDKDAKNQGVDPTELTGVGAAKKPGVDTAKIPGVMMDNDQTEIEEKEAAPVLALEPEIFSDGRYPGHHCTPVPTHFNLNTSTKYDEPIG